MKTNNLYVDVHILQNVPPCCINRDDTGSPKTAKYGGVVRARVSSQAWKHEMRKMFQEIFNDESIGIRTRNVPQMIADEIKSIDNSIDSEKALKLSIKTLNNAGIKTEKDKTDKKEKSTVLIFFSKAQAKALAKLAINGSTDKKEYKIALKSTPSVDMALFGRMLASSPDVNFDAAAQVAHAISTHAVHNEYDYFTAVDDFSSDDESGAGHLGTVEFNSSTLYRYATVNVLELKKNLGKTAVDAVIGYIEAFIKSMPTGKQNTFANRTVPDYIYLTLRSDQPVNLCGAFEKPVSSKDGYINESIKALESYSEMVYKNYAFEPAMSWKLGNATLPQILQELRNILEDKLSESKGE